MENWAKIFQKICRKSRSKHVWIILGTLLGIFGTLKSFFFFENFGRLDPPRKSGQKFFKKFAPKHVQNTFGHFWEQFWTFLEIWHFLSFFENFGRLDTPRKTGQKFSKKFAPKHVQNTFGHFWEQFLAFLDFWIYIFFKISENSTLHGTLWINFFRKNHPKTLLDTFANNFEHFWNFDIF